MVRRYYFYFLIVLLCCVVCTADDSSNSSTQLIKYNDFNKVLPGKDKDFFDKYGEDGPNVVSQGNRGAFEYLEAKPWWGDDNRFHSASEPRKSFIGKDPKTGKPFDCLYGDQSRSYTMETAGGPTVDVVREYSDNFQGPDGKQSQSYINIERCKDKAVTLKSDLSSDPDTFKGYYFTFKKTKIKCPGGKFQEFVADARPSFDHAGQDLRTYKEKSGITSYQVNNTTGDGHKYNAVMRNDFAYTDVELIGPPALYCAIPETFEKRGDKLALSYQFGKNKCTVLYTFGMDSVGLQTAQYQDRPANAVKCLQNVRDGILKDDGKNHPCEDPFKEVVGCTVDCGGGPYTIACPHLPAEGNVIKKPSDDDAAGGGKPCDKLQKKLEEAERELARLQGPTPTCKNDFGNTNTPTIGIQKDMSTIRNHMIENEQAKVDALRADYKKACGDRKRKEKINGALACCEGNTTATDLLCNNLKPGVNDDVAVFMLVNCAMGGETVSSASCSEEVLLDSKKQTCCDSNLYYGAIKGTFTPLVGACRDYLKNAPPGPPPFIQDSDKGCIDHSKIVSKRIQKQDTWSDTNNTNQTGNKGSNSR